MIGLALWLPMPAAAVVRVPSGFVNEILVSGLDAPNSMAFLPDGRLLFTEQKTAYVRMLVGGHLATHDPVLAVGGVVTDGYEQGLQGIAVDPAWPARPFIYVYFDGDDSHCHVVRYRGQGDVADSLGEDLAFDDPVVVLDQIPDVTPSHQAGCLRFGPDGMLYVSVGDDENPCAAADSTTLSGAILRIDVSGIDPGFSGTVSAASLAPPDNPFVASGGSAALVWAYGLRNPWRFQIDSSTGLLYSADVGEAQAEEEDEIAAGDFLGWPWREGNYVMQQTTCPEPGGVGSNLYKRPIVALDRAQDATAIVSGGPYRPQPGAPDAWPLEYWGEVFYGEYYSGFLRRLVSDKGGWRPAPRASGQPSITDWASGLISCADFQVGPDGSLWWLRQYDDALDPGTGCVLRIRWTGVPTRVGRRRETANLMVSPNPFAGLVELSFRLRHSERVRLDVFDLSGRRVRTLASGNLPMGNYRFQWDGHDDAGHFAAPGVYLVRLERPQSVESERLLRLR